jgi:putative membrane protein insertion efficiency factor
LDRADYPAAVTDPIEVPGRRRRSLTGAGDTSSGCDGCDIPCDGCDLPCDLFRIGLFSFRISRLRALALTAPRRPARRGPSPAARAGMVAIRGYQRWLSHRLPTTCRHTPTCSRYGAEAIRRYGLTTGSRLTVDRISRCTVDTPHCTVDPVP